MEKDTRYSDILYSQRQRVASYIKRCVQESRDVEKEPRRDQNKLNWNYFHGTIDWTHKREEDPRIHLHKVGVAAERLRAKIKGALMKYDQWILVSRRYEGIQSMLPEFVAKNLVIKQLDYAKAKSKLSDAILRGALESRIAVKIGSKYVTKPRFITSSAGELVRKEDQLWQLDLPVLGFESLHVDVDNQEDPIYTIEEAKVPRFQVLDLASPGGEDSDKPYRKEALDNLGRLPERADADEAERAAKGNPEQHPRLKERNDILLHNFFGTILNEDGSIMEWENEDGEKFPLRNICCVMANESEILLDPKRNTRLSARAPYIYSDIIRSPNNGRKALLDAGTLVNQAVDELFSLMLAGAIKSVHNVTWYRKNWIEDKRDISGGIRDGAAIAVNDSAPPGADPIGVITTGKIAPETMSMKAMLEQVFAENVLSSQTDMGQSNTADKLATELVQMSSAISDIFDSIGGDIEENFIGQLGEETLYEIVQHLDELDEEEVRGCFGDQQDLASQFLALKPKERFEQVRGLYKFVGKGLRGLIANQAKAQALINLLNTAMGNPITAQALESDVSVAKLFHQIAKGFGIDTEELRPSPQEQEMIQQKQLIREQALAMSEVMGQSQAKPAKGGSPSGNQPGSGAVTASGSQSMA